MLFSQKWLREKQGAFPSNALKISLLYNKNKIKGFEDYLLFITPLSVPNPSAGDLFWLFSNICGDDDLLSVSLVRVHDEIFRCEVFKLSVEDKIEELLAHLYQFLMKLKIPLSGLSQWRT